MLRRKAVEQVSGACAASCTPVRASGAPWKRRTSASASASVASPIAGS